MTQEEYLAQLRAQLTGRTPPAELERLLSYYAEYFAEAGADGEQDVMQELGTPAELAGRILGDTQLAHRGPVGPGCEKRHGGSAVWKLLLALCAAPIAIPMMLAVMAVAVAALVAVVVLVAGIAIGGVAVVIVGVFTACAGVSVLFSAGIPTVMYFCGLGLLAGGAGLLMIAGAFLLGGLCIRAVAAGFRRWLHRKEARA